MAEKKSCQQVSVLIFQNRESASDTKHRKSSSFVRPFDSSVVIREFVGVGQEFADLILGSQCGEFSVCFRGGISVHIDRHMGFDSVVLPSSLSSSPVVSTTTISRVMSKAWPRV